MVFKKGCSSLTLQGGQHLSAALLTFSWKFPGSSAYLQPALQLSRHLRVLWTAQGLQPVVNDSWGGGRQ